MPIATFTRLRPIATTWLAGLALLGPLPVAAQAPAPAPGNPVLMVEQGRHAAPVRRIDVDSARGLVVTASDDRTARVWDLATGELRHVLRPLAFGAEGGRLYGVAIHPREPLVAVGGSTGGAGEPHRILLFDLETGALRRTIDARGGDIRKLAWSHDGTVLLAGYAGDHALRAFGLDGRLLLEDRSEGPIFGLDTAANGLAAAVGLDGSLRLLRATAGAATKTAQLALGARRASAAAFSPDGQRLLVSFADLRAAPLLLDAATGAELARWPAPTIAPADGRGGNFGDWRQAAWSTDGRQVFLAGTAYAAGTGYRIARLDASQGRLLGTLEVARDSVTDLKPLPDGGLAYASFDGSWGLVQGDKVVRRVGTVAAVVAGDAPQDLAINADATALRWGRSSAAAGLAFSFAKRRFEIGAQASPPEPVREPETRFGLFSAPSAGASGERPVPEIGGKPLPIERDERHRALAVLRATQQVAVGTNRALYLADADGTVRWRMPVDTEIRAVHASADGRLLVAALADGTLRWWRARDGVHLLSLLAQADGRWVAWTPGGHYDASAGADTLVGWAVARARQPVMEMFSLNRFRERFNRPELIDQVLATQDEAQALRVLAERERAQQQAAARDAAAQRDAALAAQRAAERQAAQQAERDAAAQREAQALAALREQQRREAEQRERQAAEAARAEAARAQAAARVAAERQAALEAERLAATQRERAREQERQAEAQAAAQRERERLAQAAAEAQRERDRLAQAAAESQRARERDAQQLAAAQEQARREQERRAAEAERAAADARLARDRSAREAAERIAAAEAAQRESDAREAELLSRRAEAALKAAELPPTLAALASKRLRARAEVVTLPFAIAAAGSQKDVSMEVRINGRPAQLEQLELPDVLDGAARGFARLPVAEGESLVEIIARNRHGVSEPLSYTIVRPSDVAGARAGAGSDPALARAGGQLHVLAIGVSEYARADYRLGLAAKDARDFAAAMQEQQGRQYRRVNVRTLTNAEATRAAVLKALDELRAQVGPDDTAMLFFAGHGLNDAAGQYFFLPHDGQHERLLTTAVSQQAIVAALARIRGKTLVFVDTCFAGNSLGALSQARRQTERLLNDLASAENGVVVFASSTGQEESEEKPEWGNGAFTKALLDGLRGKADFMRAGRITFTALNLFISEEVRRITSGRQRPVFISPRGVPDFAVARL
jgi:hypothetical protein